MYPVQVCAFKGCMTLHRVWERNGVQRAAWFYSQSSSSRRNIHHEVAAAAIGNLARVVPILRSNLCYSFPDPPSTATGARGGFC